MDALFTGGIYWHYADISVYIYIKTKIGSRNALSTADFSCYILLCLPNIVGKGACLGLSFIFNLRL
ncbi:MAG: hypothetical protein RR728_05680, partial [Oscillospiraceae bacterium]